MAIVVVAVAAAAAHRQKWRESLSMECNHWLLTKRVTAASALCHSTGWQGYSSDTKTGFDWEGCAARGLSEARFWFYCPVRDQ